MTVAADHIAELYELAGAQCEGTIAPEQTARLEELVLGDDRLRRLYVLYMQVHACAEQGGRFCTNVADSGLEICGSVVEATVELPHSTFPSLSTTHYPLPTTFVGGPVFSYMVATVVLCAMLLSAWAYKVSRVDHFPVDIVQSPVKHSPPTSIFVGQITGMKDCVWSDTGTSTVLGAYVPFDRKYALSSGLLEITYTSGARVILEGPCDYTVNSKIGGYLSLGKLTARVDNAKLQAVNPESRNSSLHHHSSSLFSVRTPTAVVTDLGTEFGVEVSQEGDTISHVFRGAVEVQIVGTAEGKGVVLKAGQSARVEKVKSSARLSLGLEAGASPEFVRRVHELPTRLDLLDIVAGGNGLGNRRERGIDPATGKQDTWFVKIKRESDHQYHKVEWSSLIDGVFIPHVSQWTVPKLPVLRLDSVGSTFDRFQESRVYEGKKNQCSVLGYTTGDIWARSAGIKSAGTTNRDGWIYSLVNDKQYMPEGRGLLGLHANMGITFDLAAMREMHDGARPARLRAKLGMGDGPRKYPDIIGVADLWIFVDGKLMWGRKDIRNEDGVIDVDVPLDAESRFLTVVSTNGSRGGAYDWIVLGDPVLEMKPRRQ